MSEEEELLGELLPLAMFLAHHYEHAFKQDYGEFETAALMGAWDAIRRYDDTKGASLRTYAYTRITGTIIDWHRQERAQNGAWRDPKNRNNVFCVDFNDLGYDQDSRGRRTEASQIEYHYGMTSERGYSIIEDRELLKALKIRMDVREWDIMVRCVCNDETMKSVGESYGVSESRICQILPVAFRHARKIINDMYAGKLSEQELEDQWMRRISETRSGSNSHSSA